MTKFNYLIFCIFISAMIAGCSDRNGDDPDKKTNPGYVAFDYTCDSFRKYTPLLKKIYQFNEYFKQTTFAERDSVDRLYFYDVKIFHDEQQNIWTLRNVQLLDSDFSAISIQTNGKNLNETGAIWTVSEDLINNNHTPSEFQVENKEKYWHITKHHYNTYDMFEYNTEWEVCFKDDGKNYTLKGSGTLLSIQSPKLKLDYDITEPIEISEQNHIAFVSSGTVNISATDVDKSLTEEIFGRILSNEAIEITYGNHIESWDYSIFW